AESGTREQGLLLEKILPFSCLFHLSAVNVEFIGLEEKAVVTCLVNMRLCFTSLFEGGFELAPWLVQIPPEPKGSLDLRRPPAVGRRSQWRVFPRERDGLLAHSFLQGVDQPPCFPPLSRTHPSIRTARQWRRWNWY